MTLFRVCVMATAAATAVLLTAASDAQERVGWDASQFRWTSDVAPGLMNDAGEVDLPWRPEPFLFEAGVPIRYIDFASGDDANPGTREQPWKHHPWDPAAKGVAAEAATASPMTCVFKGGVVYRGRLVAAASGSAEQPIRLTRDPAWGDGPATISGAEAVTGNWRRLSAQETAEAGFPDASRANVWVLDLDGDYVPRALWAVSPAGDRQQLSLAREPDAAPANVYDHFKDWFRVEATDKRFPRPKLTSAAFSQFKNLNGATIWVDNPNSSGEFTITGPTPSELRNHDQQAGTATSESLVPNRMPLPGSPFMLENLPAFLDEPGEWFYSDKGDDAGRLYVRLPGDADPNAWTVEAARHEITLDIVDQSHIVVSGLAFTGGNTIDPNVVLQHEGWTLPLPETRMCAIRLKGNVSDVTLSHLRLHDAPSVGVSSLPVKEGDTLERITIRDSIFENLGSAGIMLRRGFMWRASYPKGNLRDVRILRNRFDAIGMRDVALAGKAIELVGPETGEIAGNVINYVAKHGINVYASKLGGSANWPESPLVRFHIHHNKATNTMVYVSDGGGIESWNYGPVYVYNNISKNPWGFVPHRRVFAKNPAYYFDHGIKHYFFNNIGWSDLRDFPELQDDYRAKFMLKLVKATSINAFNNTSFRLLNHYQLEGHGGHHHMEVGNLMVDARDAFHAFGPLDAAIDPVFSHNVYGGAYQNIYSRWRGAEYRSLEQFQQAMGDMPNILDDTAGVATDDQPMRDPNNGDFRLTDDSAAIDRGASVFVPWSLYRVVGEWHFLRDEHQPGEVTSHDVYPQPFFTNLAMATEMVVDNRLIGDGFASDDYVPGALETFTDGALAFNGRRMLVLSNDRLLADIPYALGKEKKTWPGADRRSVRMLENSFLIEAVLRVGQQPGGTIATKLGEQAGYGFGIDPQGHPQLLLRSQGRDTVATASQPIADGAWHHVIAEVDREAGTATIYINGREARTTVSGAFPATGASLDNTQDFIVGEGFNGDLDFLRIAQGTLADAQTTIEELMAWQFNGPHTRDFFGQEQVGEARDAGAIEHPTASGQKVIRYTSPAPLSETQRRAAAGDNPESRFMAGPDRTVRSESWGAISVPKRAKRGETVTIQVLLVTETVTTRPHQMKIDYHSKVQGKRAGIVANATPQTVEPFQQGPFTFEFTIPDKADLTDVLPAVYITPDGSYRSRIAGTEVAIPVSD